MRFLDTTTGQFVEGGPRRTEYAILSHTWHRDGEQTFQGLRRIQERYASQAGRLPDVEHDNGSSSLYASFADSHTISIVSQPSCQSPPYGVIPTSLQRSATLARLPE